MSGSRGVPALSSEAEWVRFQGVLAECLGGLEEDEYLILSAKQVNYYVQFAAQGAFGMRVEAACNTYIEPPQAGLTEEDYAVMDELGWTRPTLPPDSAEEPHPPDGSPNSFLDLATPVNFPAVADLAVQTFRRVYRIGHPGGLKYKAFDRQDHSIRFPALRLQRAPLRHEQVEGT